MHTILTTLVVGTHTDLPPRSTSLPLLQRTIDLSSLPPIESFHSRRLYFYNKSDLRVTSLNFSWRALDHTTSHAGRTQITDKRGYSLGGVSFPGRLLIENLSVETEDGAYQLLKDAEVSMDQELHIELQGDKTVVLKNITEK